MIAMFMGVHERLPHDATAADVAVAHHQDPEVLQRYGVRYLRSWIDEETGKAFCLAEAPSAEAAATAHREAPELLVDRIYRVREGEQPLPSTPSRIDGEEEPMSAPFTFIGTHGIREGKLGVFKKKLRDLIEVVEAKEPRLLAFNAYFNEDESEMVIVQVHPDAESMVSHMQVAQEHIEEASAELLDTKGIQVFGPPNDQTLAMISQLSQSGTPLSVKPNHFGGFTRLQAG